MAAAVVPALLDSSFVSELAVPLAQLPMQLIGHSHGASLVGEMALLLGQNGVWLEQFATLDPHPVDGTREPFFFPNWDATPP